MAKVGRMVKESSVAEIAHRLAERPNFFIASIQRLPAPEADALRQKLWGSRAQLLVAKRRLGHRALEPLRIPGLSELLRGSIGFVLSGDDVLETAKTLLEFGKTHEAQLAVRGAVVDGHLLDSIRVVELAQLPPKPILRAQVLATIESPLTDMIWTLERLIGDLAWAVEQAALKSPAASEAAPPAAALHEPSPAPALDTPHPQQEGTPS